MKRFLLLLIASILFFSSCSIMKKEHWIAVQVCQNDNPLKANNETVKASIQYPIVGHCFLIPFCDNDIVLSKIEYDTDYLELLSFENNNLYFKPLKSGTTKFKVYTDNYGNAASLKIIIE